MLLSVSVMHELSHYELYSALQLYACAQSKWKFTFQVCWTDKWCCHIGIFFMVCIVRKLGVQPCQLFVPSPSLMYLESHPTIPQMWYNHLMIELFKICCFFKNIIAKVFWFLILFGALLTYTSITAHCTVWLHLHLLKKNLPTFLLLRSWFRACYGKRLVKAATTTIRTTKLIII